MTLRALLLIGSMANAVDARADALAECEKRADADEKTCRREDDVSMRDKPRVTRYARCDTARSNAESACATAAATEVHAARPSPDYAVFCGPFVATADQPQCRRCVDEASTVGQSRGGDAKTFFSCKTRMAVEKTELDALIAKISIWQPRGYQDAGDGVEGLTDADLDSLIPDARAALRRIAEIQLDLGTRRPDAGDAAEKGIAEIERFQANERACRSDKKCMADRAARKAEEKFFAETVAPLCETDKEREQALADIAHERANPSGVVSLSALHEAGARVQDAQDRIRTLSPAYTAVRKHAFRGWRTECQ